MGKGTRGGLVVGIAAAILLSAVPTRAQPVADFYRGKTLRMLIGYGPGGGYDIYGRLVAEFLPRHLPGNPTIVAQNMPGAGSFLAAKYMYDVAPKDGTVLGSLAQTLVLDSMTNTNAKLDVAKMPYIGRVVTNVDTGAALPRTGIESSARNNTMSARPAAVPPRFFFRPRSKPMPERSSSLSAAIAARPISCSRWKEVRSILSAPTAFPAFWRAIPAGCAAVKRRSFTRRR